MPSPSPPSPPAAERPRKRQRPSSPPHLPNGAPAAPEPARDGAQCPYLSTVNRAALDFDLPAICSVTLQSHNVYICLVCGKYLQGRSRTSPAFAHSLAARHHLFLHHATHEVRCLPDGYRVADASLADLARALHPTFSEADLTALDAAPTRLHAVDGAPRLAGAVPLDNLHAFDYGAAVVQLLLRARPLRDHLLRAHARPGPPPARALPDTPAARLAAGLAPVCARIWARVAFRPIVGLHVFVGAVTSLSAARFGPAHQRDPVAFAAWLLNTLAARAAPAGEVRTEVSRLVEDTFAGEMKVVTYTEKGREKRTTAPFWFLPLDLPPKPLFRDASERTLVAQVPLRKLLTKFDGVSRHHVVKANAHKSYSITKLPPCLIIVVSRFVKNKFGVQKNPCVVHLPSEGLDLSGIAKAGRGMRYKLVGAVLHEGTPDKGSYRAVIRHEATNSWYDLGDMRVKQTMEQLVSLAETYMLLYSSDADSPEKEPPDGQTNKGS